MSSLTRQQLEAWIKTLKVSGKVLDAGGSQKLAEGRIGAEKGTEFVTLDLSEPHENSPKPDIVWDLNEGWETQCGTDSGTGCMDDNNELFDYALCFEVAEYWWNPVQALKNLNRLLKKEGVLYMSVPFIYPVHNPKHNDYMRYTDMGISKALEKAGFKVDKLIPRTANEGYTLLNTFYAMEGMRKSKDYSSHNAIGWLVKATKI